MKRIEQMSLWERLYFPEVFRGLMVTGYRFWRNLVIHSLQLFGLRNIPAQRSRSNILKRNGCIPTPIAAATGSL